MNDSQRPSEPKRQSWRRGQRFVLTVEGVNAEAAYREDIVASRAQAGRGSYDDARNAWAQHWGTQADDGLYLCELKDGPKSLGELSDALEACGKVRKDVVEAIDRIYGLKLVAETGGANASEFPPRAG